MTGIICPNRLGVVEGQALGLCAIAIVIDLVKRLQRYFVSTSRILSNTKFLDKDFSFA